MVSSGARRLDDFRGIFSKHSSNILNNIKQISFYSGCYGKKHWSNPKDVVDKDLSKFLLETAVLLTSSNKKCPSVREVQLWIKFMQPVWNADCETQKCALIKWHRSLIDEGLIEEGRNKLEDFVKHGVVIPFDKGTGE